MPPTIVRDYQQEIVETMLEIARLQKWWSAPVNLGGGPGGGGGSGIPIGGIAGQLIQSKVAYDTTESTDPTLPPSGQSLVHNLNKIRYDITQKSKRLVILDETLDVASGVRVLDFQGVPVTVTLASGYTDRVIISISGTGAEGGSGVLVKVTANDTLGNYLDSKIAEGTKITTTVLSPGGNEQLEIAFSGLDINELGDVTITSPANNEVLAYDSGGDWINQTAAEADLAVAGHAHSDVVDVSADDTTAGYLEDKIVQGSNIAITVLNEAGDEDLEIAATGLSISGHAHPQYAPSGHGHADTDTKQILVSSDDTTEGYLEDKLIAGSNIAITVLNEAGDEDLQIAASGLSMSGHLHVESDITDLLHNAVQIQGRVVSTDAPSAGQAYRWTGSEWIPSGVSGGEGGDDLKNVKVSANDTTADFLEGKVIAGSNINITVLNEGANEDLEVAATGLSISGHAHSEYAPSGHLHDDRYYTESEVDGLLHDPVTVLDTPSLNLELAGQAISGYVISSGVNHGQLIGLGDNHHPQYAPSGHGHADTDTKQVLVSSNDTTEGYLEDKIVAGTNITITTLDEGANETVEITFTASGAASDPKVIIFTVEGEVPTSSGTLRMYNKWGRTISITNVFTAVSTAPSGSALIVDINKDSTSIFTDQSKRPLIVSGAYTDTSDTPDIQTWASDSYLTMDVDQIGSTVAGSDLVVHVIGE